MVSTYTPPAREGGVSKRRYYLTTTNAAGRSNNKRATYNKTIGFNKKDLSKLLCQSSFGGSGWGREGMTGSRSQGIEEQMRLEEVKTGINKAFRRLDMKGKR